MSPEEYGMVCDRILRETMKYISTDNMRKATIDKSYVNNPDPIYISAAISKSPIVIVDTPAGSGKSTLIADRAKGLIQSGTPASEIAVLSMNIAKANQLAQVIPGVHSMTFSDFVHSIYTVNNPDNVLVDDDSLISTLKLCQQTPFRQAFLEKMTIADPLDRITLLTLFVNKHLDEVETELSAIKRSSYTLESMVCQNRAYHYDKNPFSLSEIIINGIHNMPLPIVCFVLEYTSRYGCRLYITGAKDETIYTFNMAYGKIIDFLSKYTEIKVDMIHLQTTQLSDDIRHVMEMDERFDVSEEHVRAEHITAKNIADPKPIIQQLFVNGSDYVTDKLQKHEQILIMARSKYDIAHLENAILPYYKQQFPNLKIADLTNVQAPIFLWGKILAKYHRTLLNAFPQGITLPELYGKLWDFHDIEIENAQSQNMKSLYKASKDDLEAMSQTTWSTQDMTRMPVLTRIQNVIDAEAAKIQQHNLSMRTNNALDIESADIIFSTIHSSIDLRIDNTIVYFRNSTNTVDESLYKVALSRAKKSEYLIFVNSDYFDVPVQYYLKHHLIKMKGN